MKRGLLYYVKPPKANWNWLEQEYKRLGIKGDNSLKVSREHMKQVEFYLKDKLKLKTAVLITDNLIAYGYIGDKPINEIEEFDTNDFANVFTSKKGNQFIYLNGKYINKNVQVIDFFRYTHTIIQNAISKYNFEEAVEKLKTPLVKGED